jgi:hypothetical protein
MSIRFFASFSNTTDSPQRRKNTNQATPLLTTANSAISTNGHSDFESGDETHHHSLNGYNPESFPNATAINVDSDTTSTSSQTSSEHDPQIPSSTIQTQTYNVSPTTNWPDDRTSFFATNNLASSQQQTSSTTTKSLSQPTTILSSPKTTTNNNLLTESTNNTVKSFDQVPEYKLFSSNIPSIHNIFFGNNENSQQSHRPLINGIDHDVREIEKRLMGMIKNEENISIGFSFFRKWS